MMETSSSGMSPPGSDWPLVPMVSYRAFIAAIVPEMYHPMVFEENARTLFRL